MLKTLGSICKINRNQKKLLQKYVTSIKKYQNNVNLIGRSTFSNIWVRHIIDSMQIFYYLPKENKNKLLIDVGTGAGFPGIVLAIMGRKDILLCEKSYKKAIFLKEVTKECFIDIKIYNCKIEEILKKNVAVIVSRAYASVKKLILSVYHLISSETTLVIHKGKKYMDEIEEAKKIFIFSVKKFKSITSNEGVILKIENIKKK
ncbi:MAG: Ribosomal RNA small subunit methyltransferase G [Alphaproteobacteria bacterium MarineAlpha9_Bin4]|nr:MAG: Ribosomal RNA small subunit methyltransferase G [Alphaproteobacteria bacterium MarineAlpha9_Bin4]